MEFIEQQKEASSIRASIHIARQLINDAKTRYVKERTRAKSKKQAEEMELLFADLKPYASKYEIQECYGYDDISFHEYERLLQLWDVRENYKQGKYQDRVTEMLDKAALRLGDDYIDFLDEADEAARENERNQKGRWNY